MGTPAPISEPHSPLAQTLSQIGRRASFRPRVKEKVAAVETRAHPPLLPHFPPAVTLPAAATGYFGFENKASDLFEQLFFFHLSRSPGACGHPGLGHFPRELTCFPFSTEDRFSSSD